MSTAKKIVSLPRAPSRAPAKGPGPGRVTSPAGSDGFDVETATGTVRAHRAPSCVVVPDVGDEVWLLPMSDGTPAIAAVLSRDASAAAVVALPGAATELAATGELSVRSGKSVELVARDAVRIRASELDSLTTRTRFASEAVELFASRVTAGFDVARVAAKKLDATLDSLAMRLKRSFRWVDEIEQVRAGSLDLEAKGNTRLQGRSTFVSAERVVQVRGEEIHLS